MSIPEITVSELRACIAELPGRMEVTFGTSRHSKRPLQFYRFKKCGDDLLQIELNEMDGDHWDGESELDHRISVQELRNELSGWKNSDRITFGSTGSDAIPLFAKTPSVVFSLNLDQQ